jgi:hypothetical protein
VQPPDEWNVSWSPFSSPETLSDDDVVCSFGTVPVTDTTSAEPDSEMPLRVHWMNATPVGEVVR